MVLMKFNTYWNLVGPLHFNRLFNMVRVCELRGEIWIGRCNFSIELWDQHGSISLLKQTRGITLSKDFRVLWAQNQFFGGGNFCMHFIFAMWFYLGNASLVVWLLLLNKHWIFRNVCVLQCILKNKPYQNTFIISWFICLYYKLIFFLMHWIFQIDSWNSNIFFICEYWNHFLFITILCLLNVVASAVSIKKIWTSTSL
jgi:hypothetical protein